MKEDASAKYYRKKIIGAKDAQNNRMMKSSLPGEKYSNGGMRLL